MERESESGIKIVFVCVVNCLISWATTMSKWDGEMLSHVLATCSQVMLEGDRGLVGGFVLSCDSVSCMQILLRLLHSVAAHQIV